MTSHSHHQWLSLLARRFTAASGDTSSRRSDFFKSKLPVTVTTTTQLWKVTKTSWVKVFCSELRHIITAGAAWLPGYFFSSYKMLKTPHITVVWSRYVALWVDVWDISLLFSEWRICLVVRRGRHQTDTPLSHALWLPFHTDAVWPLLQLCYYIRWQIRGDSVAETNCPPWFRLFRTDGEAEYRARFLPWKGSVKGAHSYLTC